MISSASTCAGVPVGELNGDDRASSVCSRGVFGVVVSIGIMASLEQAHRPVNGTYGAADGHHAGTPDEHSGANSHPHQASGAAPTPDAFGAQNANVSGTTPADDAHAEVPKHEVGWYFVKQYYTNLSRSPDKWHVSNPCPYDLRSDPLAACLVDRPPVDDDI